MILKKQSQTAKLLLAYEQMSQSFSVTMLVAMTAYVITFERMGRHAKRHPPSHTGAAKVHFPKKAHDGKKSLYG